MTEKPITDISAYNSRQPGDDPMMSCLVYITGYHDDQRSAESLAYGLGSDGILTPTLFVEAAGRAGYKSKIIKRSYHDISDKVLPVVLMMRDNKSVVLLKKTKAGAEVFDPEADTVINLSNEQIGSLYNGYAILIKKHEDATEDKSGHSHIDMPERHWFWSVVKGNMGTYALVLLAAVFSNLFALAGPLFIMNVYDRVLPSNAMDTGWVLGTAVLVVYLFDLAIRILRSYFIDVAGRRYDVILARRLMDQVLNMKLMTHQGSIGSMANSLREFDTLKEFMTSATVVTLVDFPFSLFFIAIIWIIGGPIAFMLLGIYMLVIVMSLLVQIPVKRLIYKSMKGNEIKHNLLLETLYNLDTVKGVGGAGRLRQKYTEVVGQSALYGQKSRLWSSLAINFTSFTQQSMSVFIILIGMYLVADQSLTIGGLIACVILSTRALAPVAQIAGLINKYHQARLALQSLDKVMALPKERPEGKRFLSRPQLKGDFELNNIGYAYPQNGHPVLTDINLQIKAGEKIGVIGRIGSGKSTLIKLMMGFYDAGEGTIKIDSTDIRQIDPADLRANIAYVSQDPGLFRGTVRENITLAKPNATDGEVMRASKLAGVHEFIGQHPEGYDALIGDNGEGFSGGQRQAIAMARAFIMNPNIMVCDEPTNAMDTESEAHLIAALRQQAQDKTFVLVTHRAQMLQLVDRVLLMHKGKLIADGPRDKVLEFVAKGGTHDAAKEINSRQPDQATGKKDKDKDGA